MPGTRSCCRRTPLLEERRPPLEATKDDQTPVDDKHVCQYQAHSSRNEEDGNLCPAESEGGGRVSSKLLDFGCLDDDEPGTKRRRREWWKWSIPWFNHLLR